MDYWDLYVLPSSRSRLTGPDAERFEKLRRQRQQQCDDLLRDDRNRTIEALLASTLTYPLDGDGPC